MKPLAEVTLELDDGTIVAHVHGEIDLSNVDDIRTVLIEAVSHESECLVLDLTDTTYLDSTGVRLLFVGDSLLHQLWVRLIALMREQRRPVDFRVFTHARYSVSKCFNWGFWFN